MSEIDKLINQAFPDELRDIEPIDVDEDAIPVSYTHLTLPTTSRV